MIMRSPIVAMLWENWRLTRVEAAWRLALGLVAASATLSSSSDERAVAAFWLLIAVHAYFWFSIAKLNGGRFLDGYKPSFPLHLLYTRPVPTSLFVGVAMAYDALSCAALYLVSAALLGLAFDQPFPMLSVLMCFIVFHLVCTCVQWSTQNRTAQWIGSFVVCLPFVFVLWKHVQLPLRVEFSLAENAVLAAIGLIAFGVTVAGVDRQRHGGAVAIAPRTMGSTGVIERLVGLLRLPCPTSSAVRAQVWFELKSSGLPLLVLALALVILNVLLFAISIRVNLLRDYAILSALISIPAVLIFGGNAFGIRRKQGRTYASAFQLTQPFGSWQLAIVKVFVRSACVLVAVILVSASLWTSSSLVNAWAPWIVDGKEATTGLLRIRSEVAERFGEVAGFEFAALAVVLAFLVVLVVTARAAFTTLRARYFSRVNVACAVVLLYVIGFVLLVVAEHKGVASKMLLNSVQTATSWIAGAALVFGTVYVAWRALADRLLTVPHMLGIVIASAMFGAACLTLMGFSVPAPSTTTVLETLLPITLLALLIAVLAPWSLSRIRHR